MIAYIKGKGFVKVTFPEEFADVAEEIDIYHDEYQRWEAILASGIEVKVETVIPVNRKRKRESLEDDEDEAPVTWKEYRTEEECP